MAVVCALAALGAVGCGDGEGGARGEPDAAEELTSADAGVDTDIVVARFDANGALDSTFGEQGVARIDLGKGVGAARDSVWGLAVGGDDKLVLFGNKRGDGDRTDLDRVVVRLLPDGALDTDFATKGVHTLNIGNVSDTARHGFVTPDGKIVASGYASQPTGVGAQSANRIVLLKLNADGTPDMSFGFEGVVNSAPFVPENPLQPWGMAEAYAVGAQPDGSLVTVGYGRAASSGFVNLVSFRYGANGERDLGWGVNGLAVLDVGENDRGRNLVTLPGGRVLMVGSATPSTGNIDALAALYDANGEPDASFSTDGWELFDFGRADDAFFGVAANATGTRAAAVGHLSGSAGGAKEDDDGTLLVLPLDGSGAPVARPAPLSETENDRFLSAAIGTDGKIYAAGYLTQGSDNRIALARFNADGSTDTTFGTQGVVLLNAAVAGTEEVARAVALQSDGKIVVAGVAETR